jgi:IclR family acetate operon transcriptional repressor
MNTAVKSAVRVLDVLELLSLVPEPLGLSDLARSLDIPKSSASALLETLRSRGYVVREGAGYRLAEPLRSGGWVGGEFAHLVRISRPVLETAVAGTGETAFLGVMTPNRTVRYIDKVVSPKEVRYDGGLSHERPAYCTSVGQVLLAAQPDAAIDEYLRAVRLRKVTPATVTDRDELRAVLRVVRERGYAESRDGHVEGASGVAAPVYAPNGRAIAGITLAAPSSRFDRMYDLMVRETLRAAREVTKALRTMPGADLPRAAAHAGRETATRDQRS